MFRLRALGVVGVLLIDISKTIHVVYALYAHDTRKDLRKVRSMRIVSLMDEPKKVSRNLRWPEEIGKIAEQLAAERGLYPERKNGGVSKLLELLIQEEVTRMGKFLPMPFPKLPEQPHARKPHKQILPVPRKEANGGR